MERVRAQRIPTPGEAPPHFNVMTSAEYIRHLVATKADPAVIAQALARSTWEAGPWPVDVVIRCHCSRKMGEVQRSPRGPLVVIEPAGEQPRVISDGRAQRAMHHLPDLLLLRDGGPSLMAGACVHHPGLLISLDEVRAKLAESQRRRRQTKLIVGRQKDHRADSV